MEDDEEDTNSNELDFPIKSCLLLLQALKEECRDPKSLSEDLKLVERVTTFHKTLQEGLELFDHVDVVRALTITKAFLAWLGVESNDLAGTITLPRKLVRICLDLPITAQSSSTELISAVLHYNAAELQSLPAGGEDRQRAVELFMATWLALSAKLLDNGLGLESLRTPLVAYSKALVASERTSILLSLSQTLGSEGTSRRILEASAQAVDIILKDGSEVANRSVISGLLGSFGAIVENLPSWELLATIVAIVETICSDKAAHLQLPDACLVWSILSRSLAPRTNSPAPSSTTLPHLFLSITSSTTSLIRHRRDLVASTAPHLSTIIIQLINCLRSLRPNLGGRQTRSVVELLPGWINLVSSSPLGTEEARSLARLLTSLTAKTIPRTHQHNPSSTSTKAESLATPLSKHAPFLLLAYVRLLTDLNSVVPSLMRRELEPGVGALCGMVGEKDRDSIMVGGGLDGGGKGILKMIWAEWEGGRYVGKG
ncbi:Urb2/Npa2 family-domain-containing protein [Mrakia frigida]|uniref:Urb2 domain-containing protein n=1 Tax=Mrakia frigida TaxID=29902 RepID=UPI003FCC1CEF